MKDPSSNNIHNKEQAGFNTALLLNVPRSESPPSTSPRSNPNSLLDTFLPVDLLNRIESISPAAPDRLSNSYKMSDIELKSNNSDQKNSESSFNEENDEMVLNQYEDIKYEPQYQQYMNSGGNQIPLGEEQDESLSTNHKSSTGSNNPSSYINNNNANNNNNIIGGGNNPNVIHNQIQLMRMQFINNFNINNNNANINNQNNMGFRKLSYQQVLPQPHWDSLNAITLNLASNQNVLNKRGSSNHLINSCQSQNGDSLDEMNEMSAQNNTNNNSNPPSNIVNSNKPKKKNKKKKKKEKDEYTIEMFGRRGWICEQCNNFNYDSRHKCNRCGIPKQAKLITSSINPLKLAELEQNKILNHKGDWSCSNCNNLNYAFRLVCNRCQMPKGESEKKCNNNGSNNLISQD